MHRKVHFTEGTSAQHLSDSVESDIGDGRLTFLSERTFNLFHHVADLLGARAQSVELTVHFHSFLSSDDLAIECLLVDIRSDLSDLLLVLFCDKSLVIRLIHNWISYIDNFVWLVNAILVSSRAV